MVMAAAESALVKSYLWRGQRQGASIHAPVAEYLGEFVESSNAFGLDILDVGVV